MKKIVIATLVGALIVFVYQSLSWMALPTHANVFKYSSADSEVQEFLNQHLSEHGVYAFPGRPPGMSEVEHQEQMEAHAGKPWMTVTYHPSMDMDMTGNMLTGFLYLVLSVLIIVWILTAASGVFRTFLSRFIVCGFFGVFLMLNSSLADLNWWDMPWHFVAGSIVDEVVGWSLCGLWLGYYLKPQAS